MRIKRIVSLALCLVVVCLALVGCAETPIGDYLKNYDYEPEKIINMDFDLYIIVGDETDDNAKITVNDKINQYLGDKYNTRLNIKYLTASEYAAEVTSAVSGAEVKDYIISANKKGGYDANTENKRVYGGKIVLVNGADMMKSFTDSGNLYDLSEFLSNDEYVFGTLNTQIPEVLVDAARTDDGKLYCIPNNRVIGEYKYVLINREVALKYNYSDRTELLEIDTVEEAKEIETVIGSDNVKYNVTGAYEDKAAYEKDGWICNVQQYPQATPEFAFKSAFAIVPEAVVYYDYNGDGKFDDNDYVDADKDGKITAAEKANSCVADINVVAERAMEIVYSINADTTLRNYLQYGVEHTNYYLEEVKNADNEVEYYTVKYVEEGENKYVMPLMFTGDVFKAHFFGSEWTPEIKLNGEAQNSDAVLAK